MVSPSVGHVSQVVYRYFFITAQKRKWPPACDLGNRALSQIVFSTYGHPSLIDVMLHALTSHRAINMHINGVHFHLSRGQGFIVKAGKYFTGKVPALL